MMRIRTGWFVAVVMLAFAAPALAQQERESEPVAVFGVGGVLLQQIVRGPADPGPVNIIGPTVGFQVRTERRGSVGYVFELSAQPVSARVRHALFEDPFAPFYGMGGAEFGRGRYIRLSAGITIVDNVAPMAGLAVGIESGTGLLTGAEVVVRVGGRPNALGVLVGVQCRIGGFAGR